MGTESPSKIAEALSFIDPSDRDTWVEMGMAVHSELGPSGWDIWSRWSQGSSKYKEPSARAVWRSFRGTGINIGTMFKRARSAGWRGNDRYEKPKRDLSEERRRRLEQERIERERVQRQAQAAVHAKEMIAKASFDVHPYLESKGFTVPPGHKYKPEKASRARGLVFAEKLLLPMRDFYTDELIAIQSIDAEGGKKFGPYGCRTSSAALRLGRRKRPHQLWWCEGYATGLSILESLESAYRFDDQVVICFSASNMKKLALAEDRGIVIADHDYHVCRANSSHRFTVMPPDQLCPHCKNRVTQAAGEKAAQESKRPYWMPPVVGMDANDYVVDQDGTEALKQVLLRLLDRTQTTTPHRPGFGGALLLKRRYSYGPNSI